MRIKYISTTDQRNLKVNHIVEKYFNSFTLETIPELLVVAGGDGALLHAIQEHNKLQVPFFGIAGGTLNFLMNPTDDIKKLFGRLKKENVALTEIKTTSIKVSVLKETGKKIFAGYAINDVVIGSTIMGYHHFVLNSEDGSFSDFEISGSGICVSTDLGSTGYNFNLGGSILPLGSSLWSINGVVCNRFLEDILTIQKLEIVSKSIREPEIIYIDGIKKEIEVKQNDKIILEKGQTIRIAFLDKSDFINRRLEIASRYRKH